MKLPGRSRERAVEAQRKAEHAQEAAHRSKEAARRAAEEARSTASHAAELARIAASELAAQARRLREPTQKAASRARVVGEEAWGHRDQAQAGAKRAIRVGAKAGRDLTSSALTTIERVTPAVRRRKPPKQRKRGVMGAAGAIVAAGGLAMAVPQLRNAILGRVRTMPATVKRAPQQAKQAAGSLRSWRSGEASNGSPAAGGGLIRGVTAAPRAIRQRFRTSVEEGKQEARETEEELRARYESSKEGE